jgi:acyl-CoA dehydrogenase
MVFAMHPIQVATIVRHLDGAPWFESYLRELAAEQRLIASVTATTGIGGDMGRSIAAVTSAQHGTLELEKQVPTVSYGAYPDDMLTTVRRSQDAEAGIRCSAARRTPLQPAGIWDTIGMRGTSSPGFVVRARFARGRVRHAGVGPGCG